MAESPDTPNVCPTDDGVHVDVVSAIHQFCNADWSDDGFNDWAEDLATEVLSVMPAARPAPGSSSPDVTALADELRNAILDIDAHATPLGTDDDGFVAGGYLISVGSLHRALGVVGHSAAKCGGCRNCTRPSP